MTVRKDRPRLLNFYDIDMTAALGNVREPAIPSGVPPDSGNPHYPDRLDRWEDDDVWDLRDSMAGQVCRKTELHHAG